MSDFQVPYTDTDIARYLDDAEVTDDHDVASIHTCVRIIGMHQPGDNRRDPNLIIEAVDSIISWMSDCGVTLRSTLDGDLTIDVQN